MEKLTFENVYGKTITFSHGPPFFCESVDASSMSYSRETQAIINVDGQRTISSVANARTIVAKVSIVGEKDGQYSRTELLKLWQEVLSVLTPKFSGKLIYENANGKYWTEAYLYEIPQSKDDTPFYRSFSLQFVSDYSYWRKYPQIVKKLGVIEGGLRFPVRFKQENDFKIRLGTLHNSIKIENETSIDIPFILQIFSVSNYVKITNSNGEYIEVNLPIAENETLEIDTLKNKVYLISADGTKTSANYKISFDSTYFKIQPGFNEIVLENGEITLAKARLYYYNHYLGVN